MRLPPPTAADRAWPPAVEVLDDQGDTLDAILLDDVEADTAVRVDARLAAQQAAVEAERSARLDAMLDAKVKAGWRSPNLTSK
jgi:hypothetical protein